jgi:hypothetical protein
MDTKIQMDGQTMGWTEKDKWTIKYTQGQTEKWMST